MPENQREIARIAEQARNLERNLDAHIRDDGERFERVFGYIKEEFGKMNHTIASFDTKLESRLEPTEEKMEALWDAHNQQEGAFGFGKWVAGVIGGIAGAMLTFFSNTHGGNQVK